MFDAKRFPADGMGKAEHAGMQQQARSGRCLPVQGIAQDGVANRCKVQAQLVGATGDGFQRHTRTRVLRVKHAIAGQRRFAMQRVDPLSGALRPVGTERQIDFPFSRLHASRDDSLVPFAYLTLLKQNRQLALHWAIAREKHQARSRHVQTVHDQGFRKIPANSRPQTILLVLTSPRHGEQASGFIDDEEVLVLEREVRHYNQGCLRIEKT